MPKIKIKKKKKKKKNSFFILRKKIKFIYFKQKLNSLKCT